MSFLSDFLGQLNARQPMASSTMTDQQAQSAREQESIARQYKTMKANMAAPTQNLQGVYGRMEGDMAGRPQINTDPGHDIKINPRAGISPDSGFVMDNPGYQKRENPYQQAQSAPEQRGTNFTNKFQWNGMDFGANRPQNIQGQYDNMRSDFANSPQAAQGAYNNMSADLANRSQNQSLSQNQLALLLKKLLGR